MCILYIVACFKPVSRVCCSFSILLGACVVIQFEEVNNDAYVYTYMYLVEV